LLDQYSLPLDTKHHGIEIMLPGPALVIRSRINKAMSRNSYLTLLSAFHLVSLCLLAFPVGVVGASFPEGYETITVVDSINAATTLTVLPDGRVIYAEQTGFLNRRWIFLTGWILIGNAD
jgi:hypothetical protein